MAEDNKSFFDIVASLKEPIYEEILDWTDEAYITKKTFSFTSDNSSKRVIINIHENARWCRKNGEG